MQLTEKSLLKMDIKELFVIALELLMIRQAKCYTENSHDVCDNERFHAQCERGEVIIITKAYYGHISMGRCIELPSDHLGCKADVISTVSDMCDKKQSCDIEESEIQDEANTPCGRGLYMYLSFSYVCLEAKPAEPCKPITVTSERIFISGKEGYTCPGPVTLSGSQSSLTASPGRQIQVSAVGFSKDIQSIFDPVEVGYLYDENTKNITPLVISAGGREKMLVTSDSNRATLSIHGAPSINFMIFLKASGCEDMQEPRDMWLNRDQDQLTLGCQNSRKTWRLRCEGVHWKGVIGNCTKDSAVAVAEVRLVEEITMALPRDVVLMIIFSTTALVALVIITSGYVSYKRSSLSLVPPQPEVALLHNNIQKKTSENQSNRPSVPVASQGPQYTLMRLHENPSQPQPPPVPPRKDNMSAESTLLMRNA